MLSSSSAFVQMNRDFGHHSPSPPSHLIYSMEMNFMCLHITELMSLIPPNEESLHSQNFSTTLVGRLVGRLIAHIFSSFRLLRFNPPVCNIYTDFICKSKSNYTAKISTSFSSIESLRLCVCREGPVCI